MNPDTEGNVRLRQLLVIRAMLNRGEIIDSVELVREKREVTFRSSGVRYFIDAEGDVYEAPVRARLHQPYEGARRY